MAQEDNRIKIRQLPESSVDRDDLIALAKSSIEKTVHATVHDVVRAGMNIDAGTGISIDSTDTGITINAAAEFDDTSLQQQIDNLQAQVDALTNTISTLGNSVKTQQSPPADPQPGDLWWDTNTAHMYVYYNSAWVQTNGGTGGSGGDIANTDAPGVVAPDDNFKVTHSGDLKLNSTVTIPTMSRDKNNDKLEDRARWEPSKSYFKGQHFMGPDISTTHAGHAIKDLLFVTTKAHTSSTNFINDLNAGLNRLLTTFHANEGGQLQITTPTGSHVVMDSYKDNTNWFGRGDRNYMRIHDNTATGYQWIFDPGTDGGAWMVDTNKVVADPGNVDNLIPWCCGASSSGGGGAFVWEALPQPVAITGSQWRSLESVNLPSDTTLLYVFYDFKMTAAAPPAGGVQKQLGMTTTISSNVYYAFEDSGDAGGSPGFSYRKFGSAAQHMTYNGYDYYWMSSSSVGGQGMVPVITDRNGERGFWLYGKNAALIQIQGIIRSGGSAANVINSTNDGGSGAGEIPIGAIGYTFTGTIKKSSLGGAITTSIGGFEPINDSFPPVAAGDQPVGEWKYVWNDTWPPGGGSYGSRTDAGGIAIKAG